MTNNSQLDNYRGKTNSQLQLLATATATARNLLVTGYSLYRNVLLYQSFRYSHHSHAFYNY